MAFSVQIKNSNGEFVASLIGAPEICGSATTRNKAIDPLELEVQQRMARGELAVLPAPGPGGLTEVTGIFAGDEALEQIVEEIYAERDRDRDSLADSES